MRRFLCFSLCLGLMVSACKKKSIEDSVNKAIAKAGAGGGAGSGGDGGDGGGGGGTVKKKDKKAAVLKACLPLINTEIKKKWGEASSNALFLRRDTYHTTIEDEPLVVLYVSEGMPLQFTKEHGLGKDGATVTKNLNEMAASKVIQDQFVARDNKASGWRVHISKANTNVAIPRSEVGKAPDALRADLGIIIYDRENVKVDGGRIPRIPAHDSRGEANHEASRGGWFDCEVDDTTQAVTLKYAETQLV